MPIEEVGYEDLIAARVALVETLRKKLTDDEMTFLLSVQSGQPNWGVMGITGIEKLPAIQWKLANIRKIDVKSTTVSGGEGQV